MRFSAPRRIKTVIATQACCILLWGTCLTAQTPTLDLPSQLIDALDLKTDVEQAVELSGFAYKNPPQMKDLRQQPKVNDLYAKARADFERQRPLRTLKLLNDLRDRIRKSFTDEELKYLVTVAQNPVIKKVKAFKDQYNDLMGTPFTEHRQQLQQLKAKVDALKAETGRP